MIKTNYKIINKFIKINHSNTLTLTGVVSAIYSCGIVDTSVDNHIVSVGIRYKQQFLKR